MIIRGYERIFKITISSIPTDETCSQTFDIKSLLQNSTSLFNYQYLPPVSHSCSIPSKTFHGRSVEEHRERGASFRDVATRAQDCDCKLKLSMSKYLKDGMGVCISLK